MSSTTTPDGNSDPFDGIQDGSGRLHFGGIEPTLRESRSSGIDPTLRETGVSGSGSGHEWTGMGSWRIRGKLGAGGEAELFVVGRDGGEVAILKAYVFEDGEAKPQPVMPDPEVLDAIRDLACPGLVRILEHGIAAEGGCMAGRYCEVMEECEGQIQYRHWEDEAELLELVGQMAKALQALHLRRIAHRDVKPANILIGGTSERVYKLGDYGIATFANRRSRLGRRDASPMYASPAQLLGLVSMTDDWWSLGMIVQESLMGRHPHAGRSPAEIQRSYVTQEFRSQVPRAVSDRWKPLLEGLLDYDPEKRWSGVEVLRWYEMGLAGTAPVGGSGVASETAGWLRRAWLFLEDGEFESAKEYAERVLDREPETGEAYWVKQLAGLGVRRESDLLEHQHTLSGNGDYQKALRFGSAELKRRLEGFEANIQMRYWRHRLLKVFHKRDTQLRNAERERQRLAAEVRAAEDKARVEALLKAEAKERQLRKAERQLRKEDQKPPKPQLKSYDFIRLCIFIGLIFAFGLYPIVINVTNGVRKPARVEAAAKVDLERLEEMERRRLAAIAAQKPLELKAEVKPMAAALGIVEKEYFLSNKARMVSGEAFQAGQRLVLGLAVRWIPAGRFTMGSPGSEEGRSSDEIQHEVVLSQGFFMAETECTQEQWEMVMGSNPSDFKGPNRPVEKVSWAEAIEYCRKLTLKQRSEGLLPAGWEWRLPTESEWEYGARAGEKGLRHGELDAVAWWLDNSGSETHTVGGKQANAWGLYDMMGNVWEWCNDWDREYPTGSVTDPRGPNSGSFRVFRGGSWSDGAGYARSAYRYGNDPGARIFYLGFRPALSSVR